MDALQGGLLGGSQCAAAGRGSQRQRELRPPSPPDHLIGSNKKMDSIPVLSPSRLLQLVLAVPRRGDASADNTLSRIVHLTYCCLQRVLQD